MTHSPSRWIVAGALTAMTGLCIAQTPTAAPTPTNATQALEHAQGADEAHPEGRVVPQLTIPLGKHGAPVVAPQRAARPGTPAASSSGVRDAAARCEAQTDPTSRTRCRARLAHEGDARAPG